MLLQLKQIYFTQRLKMHNMHVLTTFKAHYLVEWKDLYQDTRGADLSYGAENKTSYSFLHFNYCFKSFNLAFKISVILESETWDHGLCKRKIYHISDSLQCQSYIGKTLKPQNGCNTDQNVTMQFTRFNGHIFMKACKMLLCINVFLAISQVI